jgi:hypothetical protein
MNGDRSRNERARRRAYIYAAAGFWPSVGRQYLKFIGWIVSANIINLVRLYSGFLGTPSRKKQSSALMHGGT